MPRIVGCCMADNCTATDTHLGTEYLVWACGKEHIPIANPLPCGPLPKTTSSVTIESLTSVRSSTTETPTESTTSSPTSSAATTTDIKSSSKAPSSSVSTQSPSSTP